MARPRDIVNTVTKHIVSNFNYIETGFDFNSIFWNRVSISEKIRV